MDYKQASLNARWKAVARNNVDVNVHPETGFGLDKAWRDNYEAWGYPLEDHEVEIDHEGKKRMGRTFDKQGFVVWLPSGHKVLGW